MAKAGGMLRFGAAKTRSTKAKANAGMAKVSSGMAVRDSAKAAAHAAAGLAHVVKEEAAEITERAGELTERAGEATRRTGEQAMLRVGEWVMTPPIAEKLGIKAQKRRIGMLGMLLGAGVGMAAGMLLGKRSLRPGTGSPMNAPTGEPEASWAEPESLAPPIGEGQVDLRDADGGPNESLPAPSTTITA